VSVVITARQFIVTGTIRDFVRKLLKFIPEIFVIKSVELNLLEGLIIHLLSNLRFPTQIGPVTTPNVVSSHACCSFRPSHNAVFHSPECESYV